MENRYCSQPDFANGMAMSHGYTSALVVNKTCTPFKQQFISGVSDCIIVQTEALWRT